MLLTLGYSGTKIEDLTAFMAENPDVVLVDARFRPASRWAPVWNRGHLEGMFGDRYIWAAEFGNQNYRGGPTKLVNFAAGVTLIRRFLVAGKRPMLLCGCKDVNECHRKEVADRLAELLDEKVEHVVLRREKPKAAKNDDGGSQLFLF